MSARSQLAGYAYTGEEAASIVDALFDDLIARLSRDSRINLPRYKLELLLADWRSVAEERLSSELVDLVSLDYCDYVDDGAGHVD